MAVNPTPHACMMVNIARWEGLWQDMPGDPGNWLNGKLIGTMRGVTPAVLQAHLGVEAWTITPAFMKEKVTLALAAEIGLERYWRHWTEPLRWTPAADAVTDFGWGSGPGQAVKSTERDLLGLANADFRFDPTSIHEWGAQSDRSGNARMTWHFHDVRQRFYDLICERNPTLAQFRKGWDNRARWMTPGAEWWAHWLGERQDRVIDAVQPMKPDEAPKALLSRGMRGADVLRLQNALLRVGYKLPSGADGVFGGETDAAVRQLQQDKKLAVDGWVGPATRAALGLP